MVTYCGSVTFLRPSVCRILFHLNSGIIILGHGDILSFLHDCIRQVHLTGPVGTYVPACTDPFPGFVYRRYSISTTDYTEPLWYSYICSNGDGPLVFCSTVPYRYYRGQVFLSSTQQRYRCTGEQGSFCLLSNGNDVLESRCSLLLDSVTV